MADSDQPASGRRSPGAYQPIEPLDESETSTPQGDPATHGAGAAVPQDGPEPEHLAAALSVPIAVRFGSAAAALAFAGQLLSIDRAHELTFCSEGDHARWVRARMELDIARELAAAAHGDIYVEVAPGRLVEDHGWGAPPTAASHVAARSASLDTAATTSLAELIRIAGLHPVRERPTAEIRALMPGWLLAGIVRRALDLQLDTAHRPVRLHPLFGDVPGPVSSDEPSTVALIELRLSAQSGHLPLSLLAALAREPQVTLCRPIGDSGNLLVEYGKAPPLLDYLLIGLIQDQAWVLSSGKLGCHILDPAGDFTDSAACVRLADAYPLQSLTCPSDNRPVLPELQVVRERTHGRSVDAILLASDDLDAIVLLLEGHPLSESAQLIRGRDRHLLVAPGGLLERLPVGEALYCIGPGPLYLPLGFGTRPRLPVSARRTLFAADEKTAVVVLPTAVIQFSLNHREPVWALWVGPPPKIELQLPSEAIAALDEIVGPTPQLSDPADGPPADGSRVTRTWLDDAMEAEFRGALALAAELHERHGDPLRAARLFARAAEEDPALRTTSVVAAEHDEVLPQ